jgi:hypothetical protein
MKAARFFSAIVITLGFSMVSHAKNAPMRCNILTYNGHYLTVVGGGGRTTNVVHTDATRAGTWEQITLVDLGEGNAQFGLQTYRGYFLTAVDSGGRTTNVLHSDARQLRDWEKFRIWSLGYGWYTIQAFDGHYLTAVNGGGVATDDAIHSNATRVGAWEKFQIVCKPY